ncbi:MAG: PDZ domain-containing protein [Chitinophagaceae bacterium]
MTKFPVKLTPLLLLIASVIPYCSTAQDVTVEGYPTKRSKNNGEQIIITMKADSSNKLTIELDGDKVLVNGKPVDEKDRDVTVTRRKVRDVTALNSTPRYSVRSIGTANTAVLGVTTSSADNGVTILSVTKGSGAEKAGLKKNDVITSIDDKTIDSPDELSRTIRDHKAGDKVIVSFLRNGKTEKATAELGKTEVITVTGSGTTDHSDFKFDSENLEQSLRELKFDMIPRSYGQTFNAFGGAPRLGLTVQDTDDGKGVKVLNVSDEGNAAKAGIEEDDVILEVDGKAVNSADEIAKVMKDSKDKVSVKFKYERDGKTKSAEVKVPRKLKTANL